MKRQIATKAQINSLYASLDILYQAKDLSEITPKDLQKARNALMDMGETMHQIRIRIRKLSQR